MAYSKMSKQPPARDAELPDDVIAPGLYPGEVAIALTATQFVALRLLPTLLDNGAGVSIIGRVRAINAKGETKLALDGQPLIREYSHTFSPEDVKHHSMSDLSKEVALVMLGEDHELTHKIKMDDGDEVELPVLNASPHARLSGSIRQALNAAKGLGKASDALAVLGL